MTRSELRRREVLKLSDDWNGQEAVRQLVEVGAVAVPLLTETTRQIAYAESWRCRFAHMAGTYGPHKNFYSCTKLVGPWLEPLSANIADLLGQKLGALAFPQTQLEFNIQTLRVYRKEGTGERAHRDKKMYVNLIVVVVLDGEGEFFVCDDKDGTNRLVIPEKPGDAILMRAPGFMGMEDGRPLHGVDIKSVRRIFMLRQKIDDHLEPVYK